MTKRKSLQTPLCFLLFLFLTPAVFGQSPWLDQTADRAIWLEVQKPDFSKEYLGGEFLNPPFKTTLATSVLYLSGRWRLSGPFAVRAEIPFASWGYKDQTWIYTLPPGFYFHNGGSADTFYFPGRSETGFGNPLAALQLGGGTFPLLGEVGVRFPLLQSEPRQKVGSNWAAPFGAATDYDRLEAFLQDMWTFTSAVNLEAKNRGGLVLRLRTGFAFLVPTKDYLQNDLYVDYAPQVGYQFDRVGLLAALTGRYLVTENGLNFGARTIHQLGFTVGYELRHFLPGAHFRLPLDDDLQQDLDFVFGLNLGYRLP